MNIVSRAAATAVVALGLVAGGTASATIAVDDDPILYWNTVALGGLPGSPPVQTRAIAMLNIAMHDAVNAALGMPNNSYLSGVSGSGGDTRAAASVAARDVLVHLNPGRTSAYNDALAASLALITDGSAKTAGMATGASYAAAIISNRTGDGSAAIVTHTPSTVPGEWRPTPPANAPAALPGWGQVDPFVMSSGDQFRPAPPLALTSAEYALAFNEVKAIGSSTSAIRTGDQTASAAFWNAASGLNWVQIGLDAAAGEDFATLDNARLFALLGTSSADALIAGFDAKYAYDFWRPVTAIRDGELDGNPLTIGDPGWTPLNAAPAHPSYVSTLSALSGASATILGGVLGDNHDFCLTIGANERCFTSFSDAAQDAGDSRLWGGIHFGFDSEAGLDMGRQIGGRGLAGTTFNRVPEPETWGLMVLGLAILGAAMRRRPAGAARAHA